MGLLDYLGKNASNLLGEIKRAPQDLKGLISPEFNAQVRQAMDSPANIDRDKAMEMAMDYLHTTNPVAGIGGIFIGKGAKTFDFLKAQKAEDMLAKGVDPRTVWKETGTFRGVDGALRQEIDDSAAKWLVNPSEKTGIADVPSAIDRLNETGGANIANMFDHYDLARAYPETKNIGLWHTANGGTGAHYMPSSDSITLETMGGYAAPTPLKSRTLHELQHAIQQREGWARGGSPEELARRYQSLQDEYDLMFQTMKSNPERADEIMPILDNLRNEYRNLANYNDAYRRLAGEAEARLTQTRMNMTPEERLMSYPYDMLDVPIDQLIVRGLLK